MKSQEVDLSRLPPPNLIEALDFETIFKERKAALIALYPDAAAVLTLESEPLTKLLQENAYRELIQRQKIN
ncbi:MAG: baseplate assembly protein, partial [Burkholderiales bacterium]|nr:baseplate assembly protein [Burkholderiales bacterium]